MRVCVAICLFQRVRELVDAVEKHAWHAASQLDRRREAKNETSVARKLCRLFALNVINLQAKLKEHQLQTCKCMLALESKSLSGLMVEGRLRKDAMRQQHEHLAVAKHPHRKENTGNEHESCDTCLKALLDL